MSHLTEKHSTDPRKPLSHAAVADHDLHIKALLESNGSSLSDCICRKILGQPIPTDKRKADRHETASVICRARIHIFAIKLEGYKFLLCDFDLENQNT